MRQEEGRRRGGGRGGERGVVEEGYYCFSALVLNCLFDVGDVSRKCFLSLTLASCDRRKRGPAGGLAREGKKGKLDEKNGVNKRNG